MSSGKKFKNYMILSKTKNQYLQAITKCNLPFKNLQKQKIYIIKFLEKITRIIRWKKYGIFG
jgi:hypothetical protein